MLWVTAQRRPLPVTHPQISFAMQLDEVSLLADLRRPPGARQHPLVLPTHLRTTSGAEEEQPQASTPAAATAPSREQEAYVRSIAPFFVAFRRVLSLAAVDGGVVLSARDIPTSWLKIPPSVAERLGVAPGRWAVLMGLLIHPFPTCQWLAIREVEEGAVEGGEAWELVRRRTAELLARVPWAGHVWEQQQQPLSEPVLQLRMLEYERKKTYSDVG